MADPQNQQTEAVKALETKAEENYKACDLDIKVAKEAAEKAMKEMTGKKG